MAKESYFDGYTRGIGQLITQRKMFAVPEHQRDFAWTFSDVDLYFNDISGAMNDGAPDYFVGLIVLLGPSSGTWTILDGQQRLVTTTMIYAAIRNWLSNRGYDDDATQIESEFIAVRKLGGAYLPRLIPNTANRDMYNNVIVKKYPIDELKNLFESTSRFSSNRLLLEATLHCHEMVEKFVSDLESAKQQIARLYRLSSYIENNVRVVVLDVSSEANAYTIFESLNARGNELAVLDLVKNHIFGNARPEHIASVQDKWQSMVDLLEDRDTDDFLKTFWTSRFGRVQKSQLYDRIKSAYKTPAECENLVVELLDESEPYLALDDSTHALWGGYGSLCQQHVHSLILLGSRQSRAPLLAALRRISADQMAEVVRSLVVLMVRYQIVGRRRTGLLEIFCARLANKIYLRQIKCKEDVLAEIATFIPGDDDFKADFMRFSETKKRRLAYFILELERTERSRTGAAGLIEDDLDPSKYEIDYIFSRDFILKPSTNVSDPQLLGEWFYRLGNVALVEKSLYKRDWPVNKKPQIYARSSLKTTNCIIGLNSPGFEFILKRQEYLANLAVSTWLIPK